MNFVINSPGGLANQLIMLLHIYNLYEKVDCIYAPWFNVHKSYFRIDDWGVLCDYPFYESNKKSFKGVGWEDHSTDTPFGNICDPKFDGFKLKKNFEERVMDIVSSIGDKPLISVHVRHGDYASFADGRCFFPMKHYIDVANQKVKDWSLSKYEFLFFSDSPQPYPPQGILVSKLTGGIAPVDFFLMTQCNYFIHTWSTFSLLAIVFSRGLSKFKDNWLIQRV